jgi:glyoxylase-like metal-dependent hydrolase (beta-lactamase superfamily II)
MRVVPVIGLCALVASSAACSLNEIGMKAAVGGFHDYLNGGPGSDAPQWEKLTDRVYTFRWLYYRTIAINTDEGWVCWDPLSVDGAKALKAHLEEVAPGKKVHSLIYTHYHIDHTSGGAVLEPGDVYAHVKSPAYWAALPHNDAKDVLPATKLIDGDTSITVGGIQIDMIYLGNTHTDTNYAFLIPSEKLLFTADFGLVKVWPPIGGPDYNYPGAMAAFDRVAAMDFDIFVPSHWIYGKKQDFVDFVDFMKYSMETAHQAYLKYGANPKEKDDMVNEWLAFYEPMKAKYSHWHGFDQMVLFMFTRCIVGESLGF